MLFARAALAFICRNHNKFVVKFGACFLQTFVSIRVLRACLAIIYAHACLDTRSHVSTALDSRRRVYSSRPARALARIDAALTRPAPIMAWARAESQPRQ